MQKTATHRISRVVESVISRRNRSYVLLSKNTGIASQLYPGPIEPIQPKPYLNSHWNQTYPKFGHSFIFKEMVSFVMAEKELCDEAKVRKSTPFLACQIVMLNGISKATKFPIEHYLCKILVIIVLSRRFPRCVFLVSWVCPLGFSVLIFA